MPVLQYAPVVLALALAIFAVFHTWRELQISNALFFGVAGLELILIVQLIAYAVTLISVDHQVDAVVLSSYLIVSVLVPPAAVFWGFSDKSRWGTGVVALGMIAVAVICWRIVVIWYEPTVVT